jgi:hypothetical protein
MGNFHLKEVVWRSKSLIVKPLGLFAPWLGHKKIVFSIWRIRRRENSITADAIKSYLELMRACEKEPSRIIFLKNFTLLSHI